MRFGDEPSGQGASRTPERTLVPVVSIAIETDSGEQQQYSFQCDLEATRYLIDKLQLAVDRAEALENAVTWRSDQDDQHGEADQ